MWIEVLCTVCHVTLMNHTIFVFTAHLIDKYRKLLNIIHCERWLLRVAGVHRGWSLTHLVSITWIACLTTLACAQRSSILQPFPFRDLMVSRVTVVDPNDEIGIFLR